MGCQTPAWQECLGTAAMPVPGASAVHGKELEHSRDEGQLGALGHIGGALRASEQCRAGGIHVGGRVPASGYTPAPGVRSDPYARCQAKSLLSEAQAGGAGGWPPLEGPQRVRGGGNRWRAPPPTPQPFKNRIFVLQNARQPVRSSSGAARGRLGTCRARLSPANPLRRSGPRRGDVLESSAPGSTSPAGSRWSFL